MLKLTVQRKMRIHSGFNQGLQPGFNQGLQQGDFFKYGYKKWNSFKKHQ